MIENELFEFPFRADVYGTVADWAIALATITGLIYIIRTFRSQIVVQKSQIELLQIEIDRFVDVKQPYFELTEFEHLEDGKDPEMESPNRVAHLKKVGQLDALELKITAVGYSVENVRPLESYTEHDRLIILFYQNDDEIKYEDFFSFLTYKDRYGNSYRQVVRSSKALGGERENSISIPKMNEPLW